jgi:hypothetical protein
VLLSLNDNPHALLGSSLSPAASYVACLISADTLRIDAEENEDQGKPGRIENSIQFSNPRAAGSVIGLRQSVELPLACKLPRYGVRGPEADREKYVERVVTHSLANRVLRVSGMKK